MKLVSTEGATEAPAEQTEPVITVFEFWRTLMGKPRAQLGPKRRQRLSAAMSIGYSVDDLRLAIVGCKFDNWSQGQNDRGNVYDDLELICRDETKIDFFMRKGEEYLKRAAAREKTIIEAADPGVPMPDAIRARLDALFCKFKGTT